MKTKIITTIILTILLVSMLSTAFIAPVAATEVTDLVGRWHLDQDFGTALEFDGTDDYVNILDITSGGLDGLSELTLEAWIKPDTVVGTQSIVGKYDTISDFVSYYLLLDGDEVRLFVGQNPWVVYNWATTTAADLEAGKWYHIAGTWRYDVPTSTPIFTIYINGVESSSVPSRPDTVSFMQDSDVPVTISSLLTVSFGRTNYFDGVIDEVRISDKARTSFDLCNTLTVDGDTVALWHFDEGSGQTVSDATGTYDGTLGPTPSVEVSDPAWMDTTLAIDSSCNGNFGTLKDANLGNADGDTPPIWTTGLFGKGLDLNGIDDYVAVPDSAILEPTHITVEVWIKSLGSPGFNQYIVGKHYQTGWNSYALRSYGAGIQFYIGSTSTWYGSPTSASIWDGNWHHVVGTFDGSYVRLYVDGSEIGSGTPALGVSIGYDGAGVNMGVPGDLWLGDIYHFGGEIDEVRIWNSALSAEEIKKHAWGLVGEWDFNEGTDTTAFDSSGFGNDGTLLPTSSEPTWVEGRFNGVTDYALRFDGVDDYVDVPDSISLEPSQLTVEAWVKRDGPQASPGAYKRIVDKTHAASVYSSFGLLINFVDQVGFIIGYDNTFKIIWDSVALPDGQWTHVTGTYDGSWMRLYVNGVLTTSFLLNQAINYDEYDLTIGEYEGPYPGGAFKGDIDAVRVWNQALVPVTFDQTGLDDSALGTVVTVSDPIDLEFDDLPYIMMVPSGTSIDYTYTDPVPGGSGKQFILDSVDGGTSPSGTVTAPGTIIGNYITQYEVTFYDSGLGDDAIPSHIVLSVDVDYPSSVDYLRTENDLDGGFSIWVDDGTVIGYNYDAPVPSTVTGKRYRWESTSGTGSASGLTIQEDSFTVTESSTVTSVYVTQFYLTVQTDPSSITTIPGEDWYDINENVILTAPVVSGYTFLYWDVDGTPQGDGVNPITVTMNAPHTATAHYFTWFTVSGYKYEYLGGFCDDFDNDYYGWDPLAGDTSWSVQDDKLRCDPAISYPRIKRDVSFDDYVFEADARVVSGRGYAMIFRVSSDFNEFYSFQYQVGSGFQLRLYQFTGFPTGEDVAPMKEYSTDNEWHHLKIVVSGDYIKCYVDGELIYDVGDVVDPVLLTGEVGFRTWASTIAEFDNVCVMDITQPLEGWTIMLYKDGSYDSQVVTDADGYYEFIVEDPGTYSIREVLKEKWTAIKPEYEVGQETGTEEVEGYTFTAESGRDVPCRDFWNFQWLTVSGHKYLDIDGTQPYTDPLGDWTIKLYKDTVLYDETTTDGSDGSYSFTIMDPGSYEIYEMLKAGWTKTAPSPMVTGDRDIDTEVLCYDLGDVTSGTGIIDKDIWNFEWFSIVTSSSYCPFDRNLDTEDREFKLIFTRDPTLRDPLKKRLTASNPGQFMYNVFYAGDLTTGETFTITLPYPFVTQGAMPIHVYDSWTLNSDPCLIEGNEITDQFTITPTPNGVITIGDASYNQFGETATITVTSNDDYSGFVWITVHVDYGLKKVGDYSQDIYDAMNNAESDHNILDNSPYQFMVAGPFGDSDSIYNLNVFKNDPGFLVTVQDSVDTPVEGVKVTIDELDVEGFTDEDGCFFYEYKHKGKGQDFMIQLPDYGLDKSVFLRANKFAIVPFTIL